MKIKITGMLALAAFGIAVAISDTRAQNPVVTDGCCDSCDKVCQPKTETKKVAKRVYSCGWEDFCLPKCGLLGSKGCADCGDIECGRVRSKKYLIVKLPKHEECVTTCVPVPACQPACQPACPPATVVVPPPAMPLPARP